MAKFVKKPESLDAIQFDGKLKTIDTISDFIKTVGHPGDMVLHYSDGKINAIDIEKTVQFVSTSVCINGSWVAIVNGNIAILTDDEMNARYNPV